MKDPRPPLQFILDRSVQDREECYLLPFDQQRIYYLATQRTPQWVACCMRHGPPETGQVPIRLCNLFGCVNGAHYEWGTQGEANRRRRMPDQSGENNPASKLTELEVAQLRSVDWRGGYYKMQAAEAAGISMKTLAKVLHGHIWKGVAPYVSKAPKIRKRINGL